MSAIAKLQPTSVWAIFDRMSEIPRGSGNERAVQAMFKAWAEDRNLKWKQDAVGNLLITIPASKGREKAAPVLVQATWTWCARRIPTPSTTSRRIP